MILREFLYVDTDKVRSMLAQLDNGVLVESRETKRDSKATDIGARALLKHQQTWGTEEYVQKSLGDSLFPALEDALETDELLHDVSEELADNESDPKMFSRGYPPGSIIRITAPGSLFDARYLAATLSSIGAAWSGFLGFGMEAIGGEMADQLKAMMAKVGPKGRPPQKGQQKGKPATASEDRQLEDSIADFPPLAAGEMNVTADLFRSLVKMSRGMFTPGLHLSLNPRSDLTVNTRLQEGRQYLETDPEILFARYGIGSQEWTLVGSIGHYGIEQSGETPAAVTPDTEGFSRPQFADFINTLVAGLSTSGLIDVPTFPGFSVVPFAVYRAIPRFPLDGSLGSA